MDVNAGTVMGGYRWGLGAQAIMKLGSSEEARMRPMRLGLAV